MERRKLIQLIQGYIGMTPKDKGCNNWNEMQQKMADEILGALLQSNVSGNLAILPTKGEAKDYIQELGWVIDGTAETNDMLKLYDWLRQNCKMAVLPTEKERASARIDEANYYMANSENLINDDSMEGFHDGFNAAFEWLQKQVGKTDR